MSWTMESDGTQERTSNTNTLWRVHQLRRFQVRPSQRLSLLDVKPPMTSTPTSPFASSSALVETNGNGAHIPPPSTAPLSFDPVIFRNYLLALLPPVLGATQDELEDSLFDQGFDELAAKYASEGGGVIYVAKVREDSEGRLTP